MTRDQLALFPHCADPPTPACHSIVGHSPSTVFDDTNRALATKGPRTSLLSSLIALILLTPACHSILGHSPSTVFDDTNRALARKEPGTSLLTLLAALAPPTPACHSILGHSPCVGLFTILPQTNSPFSAVLFLPTNDMKLREIERD